MRPDGVDKGTGLWVSYMHGACLNDCQQGKDGKVVERVLKGC